ncbi:MAG: ABC-F family ATP-binding cassette domain-containing protein [Candidatus Delongbacteria bacterium]|nr:ABC-F family ATP-binding cassette domain-containing protein [Candidatus Delongbacteria bacterium]
MPTITLQNLSFSYSNPQVTVFEDVSLQIDSGCKTALIGRNGRGKSTLLKLLQGVLTPGKGRIELPLTCATFPYTPADPQESTFIVVKDSVAPFRKWEQQMRKLLEQPDETNLEQHATLLEQYEQQRGYQIDSLIHRECTAIGLAHELLECPFRQLSGGEQTRALIAALFLQEGRFLLLDEPTDHLDMEGREQLGGYLATKPGFILVSHDRHLLDSCTDHVLAINPDGPELTQGNYSRWKLQADRKLAAEQHRDEKLKREIRKLKIAAQQRRVWSGRKEKEKIGAGDKGAIGHQAAKVMKRALAIEKRVQNGIEEKETLLQNLEKKRDLKLTAAGKAPELLLSIEQLVIAFGDKRIVNDFSLTVRRGQRIALLGPNGAGKTTLFNAIAGEITPVNGSIRLPAYLELLRAYQQPLWQTGLLREQLRVAGLDETRFRQILAVLGAEGDIFERPLETFSQGQLKKVDLCRSFISPAHLLLWDEPLNYIDIMSREQIEEVILEFEPTLLFIEHDRLFVERVATDLVEM